MSARMICVDSTCPGGGQMSYIQLIRALPNAYAVNVSAVRSDARPPAVVSCV